MCIFRDHSVILDKNRHSGPVLFRFHKEAITFVKHFAQVYWQVWIFRDHSALWIFDMNRHSGPALFRFDEEGKFLTTHVWAFAWHKYVKYPLVKYCIHIAHFSVIQRFFIFYRLLKQIVFISDIFELKKKIIKKVVVQFAPFSGQNCSSILLLASLFGEEQQ